MILIRAGYELIYEFPKPTPLILTLNIHYSRASDLVRPDNLITIPSVAMTSYRDGFGNWCSRMWNSLYHGIRRGGRPAPLPAE